MPGPVLVLVLQGDCCSGTEGLLPVEAEEDLLGWWEKELRGEELYTRPPEQRVVTQPSVYKPQ